MRARDVVRALSRRLVVSCQAGPGHPLRSPDVLARMAVAAALGGAAGIRADRPDDLRAIRNSLEREGCQLPLIGLWKEGADGIYITPTLEHALAVAAEADVVALDGTGRPRPDGRSLAETIEAVHCRTGRPVLADVSTLEEGVAAAAAGADLVATTLAGYTPHSRTTVGPDLDLVSELGAALNVPVVAEGRYHHPHLAAEALRRGACTVVVGAAITDPVWITAQFAIVLGAD